MTSLPSTSDFAASSFTPYKPPSEDLSYKQTKAQSGFIPSANISYPPQPSEHSTLITSYQDGGVPTLVDSAAGGAGMYAVEAQTSIWETSYGMRVDFLASFAYVLGPLSALILLIFEQHNDYVRFHAYQSALLTGPMLLLFAILSILHFPDWIRSFLRFAIVVAVVFMVIKAYQGVARGLHRSYVPYLGEIAERWLEEE